MTRTEYFENIKDRLFELFPDIPECWYSFDELSQTHFLYIPLTNVFASDEFIRFSAETSLDYYESGLGGSIAFISDTTDLDYLDFKIWRNLIITDEYIINILNSQIIDTDFLNSNIILTDTVLFSPRIFYNSESQNENHYALAA